MRLVCVAVECVDAHLSVLRTGVMLTVSSLAAREEAHFARRQYLDAKL